MANEIGFYDWLGKGEVLGYIVDAYVGVDPVPGNPTVKRRVFIWEEDDDIKMGNSEAFVLHLGRRFERKVSAGYASSPHELLRALGEHVIPHKQHAMRRPDGPFAGRFKQPDPDEWTVL
ncbi:MAG: hypothetical protein Q7R69_01030 [bacterium]|nr:hypothetical protein [bacterium]